MPLTPIAPDLWVATQPLRFLGLEVGSRMSVVRLPSQELVLISPIELQPDAIAELNALGPVRHIVAPNRFHHLSVGSTQALYPEAQVWGVAGLPEKRPDLVFDDLLEQPGSFADTLDYLPFQSLAVILPTGIQPLNETVFYHRPSQTLILTDIAFNFTPDNTWLTRLAAQVLGSYNSLRPSRLEKWGTRDKAAVAASIEQVLQWDFDRVIPGHGAVVESGGKAQFAEGYAWFLA